MALSGWHWVFIYGLIFMLVSMSIRLFKIGDAGLIIILMSFAIVLSIFIKLAKDRKRLKTNI